MSSNWLPLAGCVVAMSLPRSQAQEPAPVSENRFGHAEPRPKAAGALRLATYNVLNLFDHVDDPALNGEVDDITLATDPARCRNLARAIIAMDADVLALQEVESREALVAFRDEYLPKAGYDHVVSIDVGYYRGIENSVLSRYPIKQTRVWPDLTLDDVERSGPGWAEVPAERRSGLRFQRSPLLVEIEVKHRYRLTLLCVHHKSGPQFQFHREAEALGIVEIVDAIRERDPKVNLAVLGDFNAAPWDKSLRVYLEAGLIDTLDHRVSPRTDAGQEEARLYKTHESSRVLDYVLLGSGAHRELVIGSPHVYAPFTPPESYDWRTDPYPEGYASDHYPVIIDLMPKDRL